MMPLRNMHLRRSIVPPAACAARLGGVEKSRERIATCSASFPAICLGGPILPKAAPYRSAAPDANWRSITGTQITTDDRQRPSPGGYYGAGAGQRASSYRGDSQYYADSGRNGNGYHGNNGDGSPGPSNAYHPNRARYPRTASEPQFNAAGVYPPNGNQHSYETVTTASGSGSNGEPAGYTTDPSSEGSMNGLPGRDPADNYGMNFGGSPQSTPLGHGMNYMHSSNGQGNGYSQGPPVPQKSAVPRAAPIKLGSGDIGGPTVYEAPRPEAEKRKSWFGRRLSKNK